jgi:hypothetical protein
MSGSRATLPVAVMAALLAGWVHAGQIAGHAATHPLLAAGFCASTMFAGAWVLALVMAPTSRLLLAVGVVGHLAMLAAGGWSRTFGLLEGREPVTRWWLTAMAAELVVVAAGALLLEQRPGEGTFRHRTAVPASAVRR